MNLRRNLALRLVFMEAAAGDTGGGGGTGDGTPAPWHHADHAALVTNKGWKTPDDAIKSYAELQTHIGVPAERLLKLPEKADAPEWADIRARVGWKAPEKAEDYGLAAPEGYPKEYTARIAAAAHKLGVPKDTMLALATENDAIAKELATAQEGMITSRLAAADTALQTKYGAKYPEIKELSLREYQRLGIPPELVESIESSAALSHENGPMLLRSLVAELADARREAALHAGAGSDKTPNALQAQQTLDAKSKDAEWSRKATQRGTPEAMERMRLNVIAGGGVPNEDEIKKYAGTAVS